MYIQKEYVFDDIIQVEKHFPGNYGSPGVPRGRRRQRTPEEMERQNRRNRETKLQRLILANFKPGDWHLVLNYRGEKPGPEEARKNLRSFLGALRREYKKQGYELKYIAITERGKRGKTLHHHLIIKDLPQTTQLVKRSWKCGHCYFSDLYEDGDFEELSSYLLKADGKEESRESYTRSRNLIVPVPKVMKMNRKTWKKIPKDRPGWYVEKGSVWNGENPFTGLPIQHYTLRRVRNGTRSGTGSGGGPPDRERAGPENQGFSLRKTR